MERSYCIMLAFFCPDQAAQMDAGMRPPAAPNRRCVQNKGDESKEEVIIESLLPGAQIPCMCIPYSHVSPSPPTLSNLNPIR